MTTFFQNCLNLCECRCIFCHCYFVTQCTIPPPLDTSVILRSMISNIAHSRHNSKFLPIIFSWAIFLPSGREMTHHQIPLPRKENIFWHFCVKGTQSGRHFLREYFFCGARVSRDIFTAKSSVYTCIRWEMLIKIPIFPHSFQSKVKIQIFPAARKLGIVIFPLHSLGTKTQFLSISPGNHGTCCTESYVHLSYLNGLLVG